MLHGVGQAFLALDHGLEEDARRQGGLGHLDHVPADQQARGRVAVESGGPVLEFLKGILSNIHEYLTI
jgi:hypothetical protein